MNQRSAAVLARMLRSARNKSGLSVREVARRAGVDSGTVLRIEQGLIPSPRPDSLTAIGEVLNIPAADLFAVADWVPREQLPALQPYMRAKYQELPEEALAEMDALFARLQREHNLSWPRDNEDE